MASNLNNLSGKTVGSCILERLIGQGGMGAVYLARQTRPSRNVAVKVLMPSGANSEELYEEFLARFRREADVIARLEHVNIMPVYEYGEQDGLAYLVMPYLTGGSLRDILRQRGRLTLNEAATYIDQAAAALDYAHAQGVIHRDLKPANFLLHADGRLVLADFGIARIMEDTNNAGNTLTGIGTILGTPEYMAPEMGTGAPVDYRADIYELGVVLYQMLSGRVPFTGTTPYAVVIKQIQEPLPGLHQFDPAIPATVDAVIQKATAKRREDRYQTAKAMAQALRDALSPSIIRNDPYNAPTVVKPPTPVVLPGTSPYTPAASPTQQGEYPNTLPPVGGRTQYVPPPPNNYVQPVTPYNTFNTSPPPPRANPLLVILGVLLALLLIVGGVVVGVQLNRGNTATNTGRGTATTTVSTPATTPTTGATPTTGVTPTATPTHQPTPTPTTAPSPTSTPSTGLQLGTQLYATNTPGQQCDTNGGQWANFNGINVTCQNARTKLTSTSQSPTLQGTFLTSIPGHAYPPDYVVQAQVRQDANSSADFGIYFRNQPGSNQQGTYTFLVHPNGTWSAYVYDNTSGNPTELTNGSLGNPHASLLLDIVVTGQQFTFYANGRKLGAASDGTYASGTAGVAVDQGGTIFVSNFSVYAPPGQ